MTLIQGKTISDQEGGKKGNNEALLCGYPSGILRVRDNRMNKKKKDIQVLVKEMFQTTFLTAEEALTSDSKGAKVAKEGENGIQTYDHGS